MERAKSLAVNVKIKPITPRCGLGGHALPHFTKDINHTLPASLSSFSL